jgi:glutathione synthase/RimK-type ligase-like ATP-grasp enzyme
LSPSNGGPAGRIVVVGHPGHKRVALFQEALTRRGLPPAHVLAWHDLLTGRDDLRRAVAGGALVRLESPGQDFEVEKLLLAAGTEEEETEDTAASFLPAEEALRLLFDRGRLLCPRQWYRGFRAVLRRLAAESEGLPGVRWLSHPEDVVTLFDKRRCQGVFAGAGLPVPPGLGPVRSFAELLARMEETGRRRVFIKLACGSSGSGVVAFRTSGPRLQAITTVEMERQGGGLRLYNSRRIRCYESPADAGSLIDALCREGVQVEEWLPKAEHAGRTFDLRVLVVGGRVCHIVPRLSRSPLTNLHLLNERGDADRVRAEVPEECWEAALATCRRAAALFPRCHHVGVDLLFTPGFRRHAVLEANAFGDLLPGVLWNGLDTYEAALAALAHDQVSINGR